MSMCPLDKSASPGPDWLLHTKSCGHILDDLSSPTTGSETSKCARSCLDHIRILHETVDVREVYYLIGIRIYND